MHRMYYFPKNTSSLTWGNPGAYEYYTIYLLFFQSFFQKELPLVIRDDSNTDLFPQTGVNVYLEFKECPELIACYRKIIFKSNSLLEVVLDVAWSVP